MQPPMAELVQLLDEEKFTPEALAHILLRMEECRIQVQRNRIEDERNKLIEKFVHLFSVKPFR